MAEKPVPRSPVFPADKTWKAEPSRKYYESEITAMVRSMLEDEQVREDQKWAWARWRSGKPQVEKD